MSISAAPWRTDLSQLDELKQHIDYPMVNQAVRQAKFENKQRLASYIAPTAQCGGQSEGAV